MKFLIQVIATVVACFILQYFLPWWTVAVGAFAAGYVFKNKGYVSFFAGLTGVAILWLGMSLYIDSVTHSILTEKVSKLLPINVFLITALAGGLTGGVAALTGALLRLNRTH
jgi:hypothetical protein